MKGTKFSFRIFMILLSGVKMNLSHTNKTRISIGTFSKGVIFKISDNHLGRHFYMGVPSPRGILPSTGTCPSTVKYCGNHTYVVVVV